MLGWLGLSFGWIGLDGLVPFGPVRSASAWPVGVCQDNDGMADAKEKYIIGASSTSGPCTWRRVSLVIGTETAGRGGQELFLKFGRLSEADAMGA